MGRGRRLLALAVAALLLISAGPAAAEESSATGPAPLPADFPALTLARPRPPQPTRTDPRTVIGAFSTMINGCRLVRWNNCTALGDHYVDGGGHDFRVDLSALIAADEGIRSAITSQLESAVAAALETSGSSTLETPLKTRWRNTPVTNNDWRLALGTAAIRTTGTVSLGPDTDGTRTVELEVRAHIVDVYDFSPCRGDDPFCIYRHLHNLGHATEFLVHGSTDVVTVTSTVEDMPAALAQLDW